MSPTTSHNTEPDTGPARDRLEWREGDHWPLCHCGACAQARREDPASTFVLARDGGEDPAPLPLTPAEVAARAFNGAVPVGTRVRYWPGTRTGEGRASRTRTPAWAIPSGQALVSVEGYPGGIALGHVEVAR